MMDEEEKKKKREGVGILMTAVISLHSTVRRCNLGSWGVGYYQQFYEPRCEHANTYIHTSSVVPGTNYMCVYVCQIYPRIIAQIKPHNPTLLT